MDAANQTVSGYTPRYIQLQPESLSVTKEILPSNEQTSIEEGQRWRQALVELGKHQSRELYTQVFHYFAPRLKSFALSLCGNDALAMELVQDTMLMVWQKAHLYNPEKGAASTWIFTIARNLRYDAMRKLSNQNNTISAEELWSVLENTEDENRVSPEQQVLQLQLEKYYDALSEAQMDVIRRVYLEDKPQQQVAEELDIPLGTVKSRIRLAVQKLQEQIEANHD